MFWTKKLSFCLGFSFCALLVAIGLFLQAGRWEEQGRHAWEDGKECDALESLSLSYLITKRTSATLLGAIYATGKCVPQDFERADKYFSEGGANNRESIGKSYFQYAVSYLATEDKNSPDIVLRARVSRMINRSKSLGYKLSFEIGHYLSQEQTSFIKSL